MFHFKLELPNGTPPAPDPQEDGSVATTTLPPLPAKWRVLLADDSAIIRLTVSHVVARVGQGLEWTVDQVDTGERAVEMVVAAAGTDDKYDLVILDQDFGGAERMRGTEATTAMRAVGVDALIVGFTGDSTKGHIKRAIAAGQDTVVGKPFVDEGAFKRILQGLVQARSRRAQRESARLASSPMLSDASDIGTDDGDRKPDTPDTPGGGLLCVDEQHLAALTRLGQTAVEDMCTMFYRQLFDDVGNTGGATLVRLLADPSKTARSVKAIYQAAHSIKGAASTVGCPALLQVASDIDIEATRAQKNGGAGDAHRWKDLASRFEAERARYSRWFPFNKEVAAENI